MKPHVILLSVAGDAQAVYIKSLSSKDIDLSVAESFSKLYEILRSKPTSAILIDVITKMRAPSQERELVQDVLEVFPVLQLRYDAAHSTFAALYYGQTSGGSSLDAFIENECFKYEPRTIRINPRRELCFNVLYSKAEVFSQEKLGNGQTINVSTGGCFLHTVQNAEVGEMVWLVFKELKDRMPIGARVRRVIRWGDRMTACGWGLSFEVIKSNQLEEFASYSQNN